MENIFRRIKDPAGAFLCLINLLSILLLFKSYPEYFAEKSIWPLTSVLSVHPWAGWADILWQHTWLLFLISIGLNIFGILRSHWSISLILAVLNILINQRNYWVSDASPKLLVFLLLWHSLFLASRGKERKWIYRFFTIQLILIYFQNGFLKLNPIWMEWGTVLNLSFADPGLSHGWMMHLKDWDFRILTKIIPYIEIIFPFFLFSRFRVYIAGLFIFYHLCIVFMYNLGLFSAIMIAWWILYLIPTQSSDKEAKYQYRSILAGMWIVIIVIQTGAHYFNHRFSPAVEKFLAQNYLKQKWSMFAYPEGLVVRYSVQCDSKECPESLKTWFRNEDWDHRRLSLMEKMGTRKDAKALREGFHNFLCRSYPEFQNIEIKLDHQFFDLKNPSKTWKEEKEWGTGSSCKNDPEKSFNS